MRPAIRACWRAYAGELGLAGDEARSRQVRVARFAAARLVQTAFEAAQAADRLSAGAVLHLQVASNMLEGPSGRGLRAARPGARRGRPAGR